jgi:hypothetical protein
MMMTKGKKAIRPPAPEAWAIKDKFSREDNKDISATPSSCYDHLLGELARAKYFPLLSTVEEGRTTKSIA